MKTKTVKREIDLQNLPPLTDEQRARLSLLAKIPDSEIDYSDIPRQTETTHWTRPGTLVPIENKQQVTLRLDADVLSFFKETGRRYQSRINAALREYMNTHRNAG